MPSSLGRAGREETILNVKAVQFWNDSNYSCSDTVSHLRRLESWTTALWEHKISQRTVARSKCLCIFLAIFTGVLIIKQTYLLTYDNMINWEGNVTFQDTVQLYLLVTLYQPPFSINHSRLKTESSALISTEYNKLLLFCLCMLSTMEMYFHHSLLPNDNTVNPRYSRGLGSQKTPWIWKTRIWKCFTCTCTTLGCHY